MQSSRWPDRALLWQAASIVLPLAILSGVAFYYLREDKASIEQQAREQAGILAPELARRMAAHLAPSFAGRLHCPRASCAMAGSNRRPITRGCLSRPDGRITRRPARPPRTRSTTHW